MPPLKIGAVCPGKTAWLASRSLIFSAQFFIANYATLTVLTQLKEINPSVEDHWDPSVVGSAYEAANEFQMVCW